MHAIVGVAALALGVAMVESEDHRPRLLYRTRGGRPSSVDHRTIAQSEDREAHRVGHSDRRLRIHRFGRDHEKPAWRATLVVAAVTTVHSEVKRCGNYGSHRRWRAPSIIGNLGSSSAMSVNQQRFSICLLLIASMASLRPRVGRAQDPTLAAWFAPRPSTSSAASAAGATAPPPARAEVTAAPPPPAASPVPLPDSQAQAPQIAYSDLLRRIDHHEVASVVIAGKRLHGN